MSDSFLWTNHPRLCCCVSLMHSTGCGLVTIFSLPLDGNRHLLFRRAALAASTTVIYYVADGMSVLLTGEHLSGHVHCTLRRWSDVGLYPWLGCCEVKFTYCNRNLLDSGETCG